MISVPIPVSSGPFETDWWMVAITACSVVVSGVLAWLAYWNGRKATRIASDASKRDEDHRKLELDRRAEEDRARVALAMMRALSATDRFVHRNEIIWRAIEAELEKEMHLLWSEALAHIDLYAVAEDDDELHVWFESAVRALAELGPSMVDRMEALNITYNTRRGIVLWNDRIVTSNQLAVGELPDESDLSTN